MLSTPVQHAAINRGLLDGALVAGFGPREHPGKVRKIQSLYIVKIYNFNGFENEVGDNRSGNFV